jgi:hypothetical protein
VRSLAHHRWPFDIEMQLVFSTLADNDLGVPNRGADPPGLPATPTGSGQGTKRVQYPNLGLTAGPYPNPPGHSAIITMYEACWMTSWGVSGYSKDSGQIMETAEVMVSDVHDFASQYGEFLPTGNDPTIPSQVGSIRYGAFGGSRGGGTGSAFGAGG